MRKSLHNIIEIKGLAFSYETLPVLEDIDFSVQTGEFMGIVGPNAGGKSTLLKLILGILEPQRGSIRIMGKPPKAAVTHLGYVPQYPGFDRDFPISVEQVVLLGRIGMRPSLGGFTRTDKSLAYNALREVEAEDLAARQIGTLSGGQLQRVLLARALACEPKILLLDEPTANIDQRLESDIFDLLKKLNQRMTILVVSHDVAFISSYVNRVACINQTLVCHHTNTIDGQVIQDLYGENVRMVAHRH